MKRAKTTFIIGIIIILSIAFLSNLFIFSRKQVSAQEWLSGWNYRKSITITGSSGAGTNYQIKLKVGESSGSAGYDFQVEGHSAIFPSGENDSGDLRFTDNDGTTLLPFWVESVSGSAPNRTATIWVKVSDDLGSNVNIYCYYGNSSATNVSDGSSTFIYFNDFSSDPGLQETEYYYSSGTDTCACGACDVSYDPTNKRINFDLWRHKSCDRGHYINWFSLPSSITTNNIAIRYKRRVTSHTTSNYGISGWIGLFPSNYSYSSPKDFGPGIDSQTDVAEDATSTQAQTWVTAADGSSSASSTRTLTTVGDTVRENYIIESQITNNTMKIFVNDAEKYSTTPPSGIYTMSANRFGLMVREYNDNINLARDIGWIDNLAIRKYVSPEPAWSGAGAEETPGPSNNPPDAPTNPSPANGATDVSTSPTLSVDVSDPDGDSMDVTFYNAADSSVIGTDSNVPSGGTASVTWSNLDYNTSYSWYTIASDGTDSTQSSTWTFTTGSAPNNPPDAPTLVSPADGSTISDDTPTLSAHYSDPDSGDTGVTHYRISSSSLSDCISNINIVASGTSSETSTNNEDTTWTPSSSIGSDGTYYWCAQNDDGVDASAWTEMGNFILSTTPTGCQYHNVWGWAWSERTGWISFSCENCDQDGNGYVDVTCGGDNNSTPIQDYGVDIDPNTGEMSGYAWSERVGYISFNSSDLSGCPSGTCQATVGLDNGQVSGWAKAIDADGWDPWIQLRDTSYGAYIDSSVSPSEFKDWAWSDDVIGWISFNCSNCESNSSCDRQATCGSSQHPDYKVTTDLTFNNPPTVSNPHETWDYCSDSLHPTLNWNYSDGNSSGYEIQIATDSSFSNIILDVVSDADNSTSYQPISGCPPFSNSGCDLSYSSTYYWRVKAKNQSDVWSDWSTIDSFTTPAHAYPQPGFHWDPLSPKVGERVGFFDDTIWGVGADKSWNWTIPDADYQDGTSANSQNPVVTFNNKGVKTVILQATDSTLSGSGDCGAGCCSVSQDVTVRSEINPQWQEIHP